MFFRSLPLPGAFLIELERRDDERGFFARCWCREEFAAHGIEDEWVQMNVSFNRSAGTLRGMHYQAAPHEEGKLIQCVRGGVYDVIVDLRRTSPTCGKWTAVELNETNGHLLYVPTGFAHGFQTTADETELLYLMSETYHPESSRGVRWNDPAFGIDWPECNRRIISNRDRSFEDFVPCTES